MADKSKENPMSAPTTKPPKYVKVKDSSGNEWLCPLDMFKNAKQASQEELNDCVELDVVTHTAGLIDTKR